MANISVLDCTLRDGGYCNKWHFGNNSIKKIISGLISAKIEIIECGFLTNRVTFDKDVSKFTEMSQLDDYIPQHAESSKFVLMMNYGEYEIEALPDRKDTCLDGIRVAFHKKNRYKAMELCRRIKEKGYLVFIQPMVTMLYSDEEFSELIQLANEIAPCAFYIVDSFGTMNRKTLNHYYDIVSQQLSADIMVGFHSHNNLQSAYSNAQAMVDKSDGTHNLVIDCSVYGMGRGAGNLNTELFINELNVEIGKSYEIKPILQIMDDVLNRFYKEKPWGYSLPNYLSAIHMIHPNYAGYLSEKNTLTVEDIDEIFSLMDPEKAVEYNESYINDLYIQYMSTGVERSSHLEEIKEKAGGREVLLIAPGSSAIRESQKIIDFINERKPVVISINHEYPVFPSDYIFVSNIRRFGKLDPSDYGKTISTSNIKSLDTYASVDYFKLLNAATDVRDNAGLMAIKFLRDDIGVAKIYLAGLDGYSHDVYSNFETRDMAFVAAGELLDSMNLGMKTMLSEFGRDVAIEFITESLLK